MRLPDHQSARMPQERFQLTVCLSDGNELYACRHSSSGVPPTLYWNMQNGSVLVASEPIDDQATAWNEIQPDEILKVTERVYVTPLFRCDEARGRQSEPNLARHAS